MKTLKTLKFALVFTSISVGMTSCFLGNEDPGPIQETEETYSLVDFDRLEIGEAMDVTVEQGSTFSVKVKGDRRNVEDLEVITIGDKLRMKYVHDERRNRQYTTYVTITMPAIEAATFSGAVVARITGFSNEAAFDLVLSGASKGVIEMDADVIDILLSGASELNISGTSEDLHAVVSGASLLRGFDLETQSADVDASGASQIRVTAAKQLTAKASGASDIRYRGNPKVNSHTSGASSIGGD